MTPQHCTAAVTSHTLNLASTGMELLGLRLFRHITMDTTSSGSSSILVIGYHVITFTLFPYQLGPVRTLSTHLLENTTIFRQKRFWLAKFHNLPGIKHQDAIVINDRLETMRDGNNKCTRQFFSNCRLNL